MTAATLIASLALLCSLVSIAIACLAYRRAGAIDVAVELNIERVLAHPDWWFVTVSLRNRSAISLIPIQIRLSRPRSARLSAYLGAILGEKDERRLPEAVRTAPLLKSIGEQDLARIIRSFAPGEEDKFNIIVFVPKSTSRLMSVEITVRKHESQRTETYSAQAYLPLT